MRKLAAGLTAIALGAMIPLAQCEQRTQDYHPAAQCLDERTVPAGEDLCTFDEVDDGYRAIVWPDGHVEIVGLDEEVLVAR